jgi:hypothetical protein
MPGSLPVFRRRGAPATVLYAVDGIAKACVSDPEGLLRGLLAGAIADCAAARPQGAVTTAAGAPDRAVELVAARR